MGLSNPNGHTIEQVTESITALVPPVVASLIAAANKLYQDSYLAVLFKNASKCKAIVAKMGEDSGLQSGHDDPDRLF